MSWGRHSQINKLEKGLEKNKDLAVKLISASQERQHGRDVPHGKQLVTGKGVSKDRKKDLKVLKKHG